MILKSCPSSCRCPCSLQGSWTRQPLKVHANSLNFMILWLHEKRLILSGKTSLVKLNAVLLCAQKQSSAQAPSCHWSAALSTMLHIGTFPCCLLCMLEDERICLPPWCYHQHKAVFWKAALPQIVSLDSADLSGCTGSRSAMCEWPNAGLPVWEYWLPKVKSLESQAMQERLLHLHLSRSTRLGSLLFVSLLDIHLSPQLAVNVLSDIPPNLCKLLLS